MKQVRLVLAILLAAAAWGANAQELKFDDKGVMVLEAETCTLEKAEIVEAKEASGGKGVKVLAAETKGSLEITLDPGKYVVNTYLNAPAGDQDAFYIAINDVVQRVYPSVWGQWAYCTKFLEVTIDNAGKQMFKFASNWVGQKPGEINMIIDRFEIVKADMWKNPLPAEQQPAK